MQNLLEHLASSISAFDIIYLIIIKSKFITITIYITYIISATTIYKAILLSP